MSPRALFERQGSDGDFSSTYVSARDHAAVRSHLEEMWGEYEQYADQPFHAEFARHLPERYWEMYLACWFRRRGWELAKPSPGEPDICASWRGTRVWIEATFPSAGVGGAGTVQWAPPGVAGNVPEGDIAFRIHNAIETKRLQHREHFSGRKEPVVLAINLANVQPGWLDYDPPHFLRVLLGIREVWAITPLGAYVRWVDELRTVTSDSHEFSPAIFREERFDWITAVAFGRTNPWQELWEPAELYIAENPRATTALPREVFPIMFSKSAGQSLLDQAVAVP